MSAFEGQWKDDRGFKISIASKGGAGLQVTYLSGRGPFEGTELSSSSLAVSFGPQEVLTGTLDNQGNIGWSNGTHWQRDTDAVTDPARSAMEDVQDALAKQYFQTASNPWINGIAIGSLQQAEIVGGQTKVPPQEILVFFDPTAECELAGIDRDLKNRAQGQPYRLVRGSRPVALQAPTGASISPYTPFRYQVPPVMAGTFGALVKASGKQYILSSNHVLAHNGRVQLSGPVVTPGLLDDANAGSVIGSLSYFGPLKAPAWPANGAPANIADCALAEVAGGAALAAPAPVPLFSSPVPSGTPVTKTGRTTQTTHSQITVFNWRGYIDCSFGAYYFRELVGTYGREIFAAPGDSGSLVVEDGGSQRGVGLVTARGYIYDPADQFTGYVILICSLGAVAQVLANEMGIQPGDLTFFR